MRELHIIEPTLADQAGHCHGYVQSLIRANTAFDYSLHIWLDRRGRDLYRGEDCHVHPYFFRQLRKLQKLFCLRSLLRSGKSIFIPTAGRIDLVYLDWLLKNKKYPGKIFLHFHQFKISSKKVAILKKIAKRHPEFIIMVPTAGLLTIFKEIGFQHCEQVPCPSYAPLSIREIKSEFKKIVYAGSARTDKGFPEVVNFLEYLKKREKDTPIELQISPPFSGRYDEKSKMALSRLKNLSLPKLIIYENTLNQEDYQQLFIGAVCLLVYDPMSYRDKFSGVTLDALYAGCPLISVTGTWAGNVTQQFQAGVTLVDRSSENIYEALTLIRRDYAHFHENAKRAGEILSREHDPANTLRTIEKLSALYE